MIPKRGALQELCYSYLAANRGDWRDPLTIAAKIPKIADGIADGVDQLNERVKTALMVLNLSGRIKRQGSSHSIQYRVEDI